mmetsp:Transcript_34873/g.79531  ORF Transcript_34873/g.79531 Transcript_34873/m.79531 type:complete len:394 (-) Transcript_34873:217-1398(-)
MLRQLGLVSRPLFRHGAAASRGVHNSPHQMYSFYDTNIERTASAPLVRFSLQQISSYGQEMNEEKMLKAARYVHKELTIRIAKQLRYLQTLPYILMTNPHITEVHKLYHETLQTLQSFPYIDTVERDIEFTKMLSVLFQDTKGVVDLMGRGLAEATHRVPRELLNADSFMDEMLRSRIGRRVLAEQHLALHSPKREHYTGVICSKTSPLQCMKRAEALSAELCRETYGVSPEVEYSGELECTFTYIPFHLEYQCVELLKNAMRATVERHVGPSSRGKVPPIKVLLTEGPTEVAIRISDEGGGVPRYIRPDIFKYGFTTVKDYVQAGPTTLGDFAASKTDRMIAGRGFGLPMSQLYAGYYGGSMSLISLDGHGTDVFLCLDKTGTVPENVGQPA